MYTGISKIVYPSKIHMVWSSTFAYFFFFFFCRLRLSGGTLNIRAHTWGDTSTLEYSKNLPYLLRTAETHHVPQIYMAIYKTVLSCLGAWQVTLNFVVFFTKSTMCTHITGLDPLPPRA